MSVWVQILLTIAFVSLIVVLISQNRHPVRTLAWILILCLIPVLGLVLYLVFGTEKKRSRLVSDSRLSSIKEKAAYLLPHLAVVPVVDYCRHPTHHFPALIQSKPVYAFTHFEGSILPRGQGGHVH